MPELKALLMTNIQDSVPLTQYFPLNYNDDKSITELLIISKHFKNCGKGILVHNKNLYYYKTYIPQIKDIKDNNTDNPSLSQSYSDYFLYNLDCNKKKFFILIYCDLNYKEKNIDNLINDIFAIFDEGAFDGHELKKNSRDKINSIFKEYQKLSTKFDNIDLINSANNIKNFNSIININSNNSTPKKRIDSRIIIPIIKKVKTSEEVSADIEDITSIKDSNSNISLMFRYTFNDESFYSQNKELQKIKFWNIVFFLLLLIIQSTIFSLFILFS